MEFILDKQFKMRLIEERLSVLESEREKGQLENVLFDFTKTAWFDIASLLFFISLLNYLKNMGVDLRITLPEGDMGRRARNFLKRWKFYETLDENVDKIENLIPEKQLAYLSEEQKYYLPREIEDPFGNIETLLSSRLVEITSFTKISKSRRTVSIAAIKNYIAKIEKTTIRPVIEKALGIRNVEIFSKSIVKEGLLNTEEHPDATISLLGMSRRGRNLVIGIVDNGKGIPETLRDVYVHHLRETRGQPLADSDLIKRAFDKKIIEYSTRAGTTSIKEGEPRYQTAETERGMGLYYLKKHTLDLGGCLIVRSGKAAVTFRQREEPSSEEVSHWGGTLIKIILPLRK